MSTAKPTRLVCRLALTALLVVWIAPGGALQASAVAAQEPEPTEPEYVEPLAEKLAVIPPGRDDVLADMLGRGATLPGECTFTKGQVERDVVTATYACPNGPVVVTLRHPSKAPADAKLTERFALAVESGTPPAELANELASRIRSRESTFEWTWIGGEPKPRSLRTLVILVVFAVGVLLLALRRRRRQPKAA